MNVIADLKQIIAEQEKDLACLNEEKRYFQMRLMSLERSFDEEEENFVDSEDFDAPKQVKDNNYNSPDSLNDSLPNGLVPQVNGPCSMPPPMATIPECDEC